jgi:hypothetical protein
MSKFLLSATGHGVVHSGVGAPAALSARVLVRALWLCAALLAALAVIAVAATSASAATGFEHVGAFSEGSADGATSHNKRIAVELSSGNVFKTDTVLDQVTVYAPTETAAVELTAFGAGDLTDPFGVAVDQASGDVYVSDDHHVVKYVSDGAPVPTFTKDVGFASPAVTGPLAFDQTGHELLVADKATNTVRRYSTSGVAGATFDGSGGVGSPGAFVGLQDLAVDSTGDVIVVDSAGDPALGSESSVYRYDGGGDYEATLGPVPQAATVTVLPDTDEVVVSGNQDAAIVFETPTVTVFAADSSTADVAVTVGFATISGLSAGTGLYGRLYVATDVDSFYGGIFGQPTIQVYELPVQASGLPAAVSEAATDVQEFSARLNGDVDTHGFKTTYHFEYAVSGSGDWAATPESERFKTLGPVSAQVAGLRDDTNYDVRLLATNTAGSTTSTQSTFRTLDADPPTVTVEASITIDGADLQGTVNPEGHSASYRFEYSADGGSRWTKLPGPDGDPATDDDAGAGTGPVVEQASLSGLPVNGTYMVRLVATNGAGASATPAKAFALTMAANPDVLSASSALLAATVDTHGLAGSYRFAIAQTDGAYTGLTDPGSIPAAVGLQALAQTITGLPKGGAYEARLRVTSGGHTRYGDSVTFSTPADGYVPRTAPPVDSGGNWFDALPPGAGPFTGPAAPSSHFTVRSKVSGASLILTIGVPGKGTLTAGGSRLGSITKRPTSKGDVRLTLRLTAAGRAALKRAKSKQLRTSVTVRFTPSGGAERVVTRAITFKRGGAR